MSDILTPDEVNGIEPSDHLEIALIKTLRAAWAERDAALTKLKQYEERDRVEANWHRLSPPSHLENIADATIRAERDQAMRALNAGRMYGEHKMHCQIPACTTGFYDCEEAKRLGVLATELTEAVLKGWRGRKGL